MSTWDDKPNDYQHALEWIERLRAINADLLAALQKVIAANDEFRRQLPADWEGDPINDACVEARTAIARAEGDPINNA